jgi:hypothetical protein
MKPSMTFCKDAVRSVENIQVKDLMKLLGTVKAGRGRHHHRKLPDKPQKTDHKRQGGIQNGNYNRPCSQDIQGT